MGRTRIIPVLLLHNGGLWKGKYFKNHKYIGDPINAVRIFNEKEVDELAIIDISATLQGKAPNIDLIKSLCSEAFMPISCGGGITKIADAEQLFYFGAEKIIINSAAIYTPGLIKEITSKYGAQSVIVSLDFRRNWLGKYQLYTHCGQKKANKTLTTIVKEIEQMGAGEILLTAIDHEGSYKGYDLNLISAVSRQVTIPIVANGGAGTVNDFHRAVEAGASGVAAGSMFVLQRPHDAVLLSYISSNQKIYY